MKRKMWLSCFGLLLLGSSLLAGCSVFGIGNQADTEAGGNPLSSGTASQSPELVIVEGRIVPQDHASLFFTGGGQVAEVLVQEGDQVAAGQVLARLGDREPYEANLAKARLELVDAQQQVDDLHQKSDLAYQQARLEALQAEQVLTDAREWLINLDTDDYQNDLDDARVKEADAKTALDDAQDEFDKYKDLDKDQADRKNAEDDLKAAQEEYDQAVIDLDRLVNDLEQARTAVLLAQARLEDAQSARDARQDGPDPDNLALAEARLDNAKAQVAAAQAALDRLDLTAPFAGRIARVDITVGEQALPNQPVMVLADFSAWFVETTDLTEYEVVSIEKGQSVLVIPDALPGLELTGKVEKISDTFSERAGDINYTVRIRLDEVDALSWGMTVEVQFQSAGR